MESVKAKHILVRSKEAAELLKREIDGGLAFEDAAAMFSSCPSHHNGGDLGSFTRGKMVQPFEDAAFLLEQGEISIPIQSQFGWHLIKVY